LIVPSLPEREAQRLAALSALEILDTPPEAAFDRIAALLRGAFGAPVAIVGFLDEERHWFKAREGLEVWESPRAISFCTHAIQQDEVLWVADAAEDPRFRENPLVVAGPKVRFYAGAPVVGDGGERVGTVCVLDTAPRAHDPALAALLADLARLAADQLELGRHRLMRKVVSSLIASTTDAMLCADRQGRITFWNTAAETVFGWTAAEAIGRSHDLIAPGRLSGAQRRGYARVLAGEAPELVGKTVEVLAVHKSGREIPVELSLSLWGSDEDRGVGAIVRDISDRKHAEEELARIRQLADAANRESVAAHDTMALLVRSATTPLVMTDADLNVIDVSDRWVDSYGRARETVVGRSMHDIFPGARERWDAVYRRCLAGGRERGERAVSIEGVDGSERWFQWDVAPWRDAGGEVAGLLLTNHDVTALVEARNSAEQAQVEAALARDAAEGANRAKDEFLANMSHEVRTPLNGVLGMAGALALSGLNPVQAEMLATIQGSGRDLERMLTGVLELVRVSGNAGEAAREPLDLDTVLADLVEAYRAAARAKGLELRSERSGDAGATCLGDRGRIVEVLDRLLDNALKFTAIGWVSVGLDVRAGAGGRLHAEFAVTDTGVGFDPAQAERLFDRFHQADGSSTRRFGGSGVGLAVCRALAGGMGGVLEAASRPGEGSRFTLTLDMSAADPLSMAAVSRAAA
jgi:PAS domain S-box-containing protein